MLLSTGELFGPYEILAPLGAGGMGEVYRAKDIKLDREVALKVLPSAVAQDRERMARFEREAKVLASLNHPNIAQIYGLAESGSARGLVMELVRGSILPSPQQIDAALNCAQQIADALEAAHEKGITHRDLKPANIMVTPEGTVKLLDFGLAAVAGKDGPASGPGADVLNSPTLTMAATQAGVILGTAAYMSPEQAAGKVADRRSDIWSFGVVLFEMLTGERLFAGETVSHTLADVLRAEIPFQRLPPAVPAPIRELLKRCLDRDVRMRLQSIGEARIAIQRYVKNPSPEVSPAIAVLPRRDRRWLWPSISGALAILLLAGALVYMRRPAEISGSVRLSFTAPPEASFNDVTEDDIVISPDGRSVAFTARDREGHHLLWVRPLDSPEAKPLPGTDTAGMPFWSPDSRSLGFGARGKLKRLDLAGNTITDLCDAPRLTGGTWNRDGIILFSPDYRSALYRIPATGGTPVVASLKNAGGETQHLDPTFLPDGKHFLFRVTDRERGAIMAGVLGSLEAKPVLNERTQAEYAAPGWLLFVRHGSLLAQRFDASRQELEGDPLTVLSLAKNEFVPDGRRLFSVSNNGVLVWQGLWSHAYQLVWRDREGRQLGALGPVVNQNPDGQEPRLSPDGRRVAFKRENAIWVTEAARDVPVRLMGGQIPIWSPDSARVALLGDGIRVIAANGVGEADKLADGVSGPGDWSRDGRFLLFWRRGEKTRIDIWALPLAGERKAYPLLNSPAEELLPRFSPDGHSFAYTSDESGSQEVYVRSFTADGHAGADRKRISSQGGFQPIWRRDGGELFYLSPTDEIMSVAVNRSGAQLEFGVPKVLFKTRTLAGGHILGSYDVAPDGQRFLIGELAGEATNANPMVILNWTGTLPR